VDVAHLVSSARPSSALSRAARTPFLHFVVLGAVLALVHHAVSGPTVPVIRVTPALLDRLAAGVGGHPGRPIPQSAVEAWIDEEVLYEEGMRRGLGWNPAAIARLAQIGRFVGEESGDAEVVAAVHRLGLDREDAVVRAQVAGRMRLLLRTPALRQQPDDAELEAYLAAHRERFRRLARVTFAHVFVRRDRGPAGRAVAAEIARRLQAGDGRLADARRRGDEFTPGDRFAGRTHAEVESLMGTAVAAAVMAEPAGAWSAPVEGPYGWHVLRVEARTEESFPTLAEIRAPVAHAWRTERAGDEVATQLRHLRASVRVEIDPAARARLVPSS
jgi:hypothetical protein